MKKISRYEKLGFKVVLEQSWLNLTLDLLLQQKTVAEIREILNEAISVTGKRSAQTTKFAISILSAWFDPENDLVAFRDQLVTKAHSLPQAQWSALHWACLTASYPFLLSVSTVFGRLLTLQDETTKAQLLSRLQDIYGTRETVERALYYSMGTLVNLGLVEKNTKSGILTAPEKITHIDDKLGMLLWKAILHATQSNRLPVHSLRNSPALYPFDMPEIYAGQKYEDLPELCFNRYGSDEILMLQ